MAGFVETACVVISTAALFIGWATMLFGGLYVFVHVIDWLFMKTFDRTLRFFDVTREFLEFAIPRIRARKIARREGRRTA